MAFFDRIIRSKVKFSILCGWSSAAMTCKCILPPSAEDVMMETVVEVSTECGPIEEDSFPIPPDGEPAAKKKRGGQCGHFSYSIHCLNVLGHWLPEKPVTSTSDRRKLELNL